MKLLIEIDTDRLADEEYEMVGMSPAQIDSYLEQNDPGQVIEQLKDVVMAKLAEIIAP